MDNETNIQQDEAFLQLEGYLSESGIPYHRSKFKFVINNETGYNFIIPGAIIFVCSKNKFIHTDSVLKFERFLVLLKEKGINLKIYVYVSGIDSMSLSDLIKDCGINSYGLDIKYVADIKEIIPADYIYYAASCGPIYTFAVQEDVSQYTYPIYILKNEYDRACAFMTDSEIKNVNRLDIIIVDELPDNCYKVKLNKTNGNYKDKDYINRFVKQMTFIPLPGGNRMPVRLIEGHTALCDQCKCLFKVEYIKDGICFKCKK